MAHQKLDSEQIEEMKAKYEYQEKKNKTGHDIITFVVTEPKVPEIFKGKYLQISIDETGNYLLTHSVTLGLSDEEKAIRKKKRVKFLNERQEERKKLDAQIKGLNKEYRSATIKRELKAAEVILSKIGEVEQKKILLYQTK